MKYWGQGNLGKVHIQLVHSLLLCTLCASGTPFIGAPSGYPKLQQNAKVPSSQSGFSGLVNRSSGLWIGSILLTGSFMEGTPCIALFKISRRGTEGMGESSPMRARFGWGSRWTVWSNWARLGESSTPPAWGPSAADAAVDEKSDSPICCWWSSELSVCGEFEAKAIAFTPCTPNGSLDVRRLPNPVVSGAFLALGLSFKNVRTPGWELSTRNPPPAMVVPGRFQSSCPTDEVESSGWIEFQSCARQSVKMTEKR